MSVFVNELAPPQDTNQSHGHDMHCPHSVKSTVHFMSANVW